MNIGFYGKGGSGKTTLSALFSLYLDKQNKKIGLLDVDVNSHTSDVLGIAADETKVLSRSENELSIWKYLSGVNTRVQPSEFLNTTPPGRGSGMWTMDSDNFLTKSFGQSFGKQAKLFTVGTYEPESVGISCHHTTQSVAENMVSHFNGKKDDVLVIDSVAGNDAFGTTLFLNDLLVFVVKPEREGVSVMKRFLDLAEAAGISDHVVIVGNQVGSKIQEDFLRGEIPADKLMGTLKTDHGVIDMRLQDKPLDEGCITSEAEEIFNKIYKVAEAKHDKARKYAKLINLHTKVAAEDWVAGSYRTGLVDQIDPECAHSA